MLKFLRKILGSKSYPLNKIELSSRALISNYQALSSINPDIKVAPVLKSNAYGHGIELTGKILDSGGVRTSQNDGGIPFFCVDSLFEAYQLKKIGIKTPILIMGYIDPKSLKSKRLPFQYTLFDLSQAKALNEFQKGAKVHIFVDTGMNREGIKLECRIQNVECRMRGESCLRHFIEEIRKLENIEITGLMSHLACSDQPDSQKTKLQIRNFKQAKKIFQKSMRTPPRWQAKYWFHLGGSLAFLQILKRVQDDKKPLCNLIRCGKAIYGVGSNIILDTLSRHSGLTRSGIPNNRFPTREALENDNWGLKPVLSLHTKIVQIKEVSKGNRIGYSETFLAKNDLVIGILPIGYNDGVDRRLSNKGVVLVDGVECKIIGLISMNVTTIDLSAIKNPFLGQEVMVFSDNPKDPNSIEQSATLCNTIPHEILIHLNPTTRRELC